MLCSVEGSSKAKNIGSGTARTMLAPKPIKTANTPNVAAAVAIIDKGRTGGTDGATDDPDVCPGDDARSAVGDGDGSAGPVVESDTVCSPDRVVGARIGSGSVGRFGDDVVAIDDCSVGASVSDGADDDGNVIDGSDCGDVAWTASAGDGEEPGTVNAGKVLDTTDDSLSGRSAGTVADARADDLTTFTVGARLARARSVALASTRCVARS
jgi:hypothetical protein